MRYKIKLCDSSQGFWDFGTIILSRCIKSVLKSHSFGFQNKVRVSTAGLVLSFAICQYHYLA